MIFIQYACQIIVYVNRRLEGLGDPRSLPITTDDLNDAHDSGLTISGRYYQEVSPHVPTSSVPLRFPSSLH